MARRRTEELRRRAVAMAELRAMPIMVQVEFADALLANVLSRGLPFPHDVDGEEALRRARAQIQIALDNGEER